MISPKGASSRIIAVFGRSVRYRVRGRCAVEIEATLIRIQQETPSVKSFLFDLGGADLVFKPGQWVDLYVDTGQSVEVGGYSITSTPLQRGIFELAVKKLPQGTAAIYLHEHAKVGDSFVVHGGFGGFHYDPEWSGPLVLIAGGIGITPIMSILRYVDEARLDMDVLLIYSARSPSELVFYREIKALVARNHRIRCVFTVTRPQGEAWDGQTGRIGLALLRDHLPAEESLYYLCGPPPLQDGVLALLAGLGVSPSRIKVERWW